MTHLSELLNASNTQGLSARRIAEAATSKGHKISHVTVAKYLIGEQPSEIPSSVLDALASVLPVSLAELEVAAGKPKTGRPFILPRKADTLDDAERGLVLHLIDVLVSKKEPQGMPGTVAHEVESFLKEKEKPRASTADEMWDEIGKPTPDGGEFRPDKYQNHKMLWERYGNDWKKHYTLAAKKEVPGDDIDEPYAY